MEGGPQTTPTPSLGGGAATGSGGRGEGGRTGRKAGGKASQSGQAAAASGGGKAAGKSVLNPLAIVSSSGMTYTHPQAVMVHISTTVCRYPCSGGQCGVPCRHCPSPGWKWLQHTPCHCQTHTQNTDQTQEGWYVHVPHRMVCSCHMLYLIGWCVHVICCSS